MKYDNWNQNCQIFIANSQQKIRKPHVRLRDTRKILAYDGWKLKCSVTHATLNDANTDPYILMCDKRRFNVLLIVTDNFASMNYYGENHGKAKLLE